MAVPDQHPAPAEPKRPRSRLRKWGIRVLIFVVGFVLLVGIVIQAVLWTGLPKKIVVGQVEKGLGLRVGVTSVSTGWLGRTSLHGVKLALPLSDQAFADVPDMKVRHTSLIAMIFGRPLIIKEIELDQPVIQVWQEPSGRWNLADVAELLARIGGKKTGEETASSDTPVLPSLNVKELKAVVRDNRGRQLTVEPVNVTSGAETPVSYAYDLEIPSGRTDVPPHVSLKGRVAPGGTWAHAVRVWVHDIDPWIAVWKPGFNVPFSFDGNWTGELAPTGVKGFVQITDARYADYRASGGLTASRLDTTIRLAPANLHVRTPVKPVPELTVARGEITYDGTVARLTRLEFAALGGPAELNGWYEPSLNQGALEAYWQDMTTGQVRQSGKLNIAYKNPLASNLTLDVLASSSGTATDGPFEAVVKLNAAGRSFQELNWRLETPQLAWHRPQPLLLDGLTATGTYRQDGQHQMARLASVALPTDNRLNGTGSYDLTTKQGELHLNGQDWPVHVIEGTRLAFALDASGRGVPSPQDPKKTAPIIELNQFYLRSGNTGLTVKGTYDGREPKPVTAEVVFENLPGNTTSATPATSRPGEPELLQGFVRGNAKLNGTLSPLKIDIEGRLASRDAMILNHVVGDMSTGLKGSIDYDKAVVRADAIPFLDGLWTLGATYVTHKDDKPVYATEVDLAVEHLSLPKVSQFLDSPRLEGTFDGRWYLYYPGLKPNPTSLILTGGGGIDKLSASSFIADKVTYKTTIKQGQISIDPIEITRGNYGTAKAAFSTSVDQPRRILAGFDLAQFPVDFGPLGVQTTGGSHQMVITLPNAQAEDPRDRELQVQGQVVTRTSVAINQQPIGEIRSTTNFLGRTAELTETEGDLLAGHFNGNGSADVDDLNRSRLSFEWKGVQSDRLVRLFPQMKGFGGTYSGNLRLQPALVPRPLQPLSLEVFSHAADGHWRTVRLGDAQIHAFVNPATYQIIASESKVTSLQVGGGSLDVWFSGSRHIDTEPTPEGVEKVTGVTISNIVNVTLNNLQVDQFVQAFDPGHPPGLGKLNGEVYTLSAPKTKALVTLAGPTTRPSPAATAPAATAPAATQPQAPEQPQTLQQQTMLAHILATTTVDGNMRLENSNLAQYSVIASLYNTMHLGGDMRTPTGRGTVSVHMEQGQLHVSNLYFFNRGLEVRGVATADRTWELPDNPISGSVVGTLRPLKSIKFPLLAEADAILTQIQGGLTGVEFAGTVKNPTQKYIREISLTQFGSELRGLLLGEIGNSR
jgi:hypothetical protein